MAEKTCPTCKEKYDDGGNHWKKVCYDCYKNFRYFFNSYGKPDRIRNFAHKEDIYISHPNVTKEEMDAWIAEKKYEHGWGCEELKPENWSKFKLWRNSTNYD